MKTYTILATSAWEKLDNTYLSLICSIVPEADTYISMDGWTTSVLLAAGKGITVSLQTPVLYFYGTENKLVYIYDGAVQTISDLRPLSGAGTPEWTISARFIGDIYIDTDTNDVYVNDAIANTWWKIMARTDALLTSGKIPIASTGWKLIDGQTPLSGTKEYYVSLTSGWAVTTKITFVNGILTAVT